MSSIKNKRNFETKLRIVHESVIKQREHYRTVKSIKKRPV